MHSNRLDPPEYSYRVLKSHKTSFERQIWEGILINNEKCDNKLNGKGEWGINLIPTIKVTTQLGDLNEPIQSNQQLGLGQNNGQMSNSRSENLQVKRLRDDRPIANSAPNDPNALDFLSQFQQRKKARKHAVIESRLENEGCRA